VDREEIVEGRLRRYYRLTPEGTRRLAAEAARLQANAAAALARLKPLGWSHDRLVTAGAGLPAGAGVPPEGVPARESEDEMLAVLLATAHEGQRRVGLAGSADLLRGAVRMHFGLSRSPRPVRNAVRLMCIGQGTGEDAWPVARPDVIATTVLWLAGVAAALLIFSETASPYHRQEPAQQ
jgi:hypothetical protein